MRISTSGGMSSKCGAISPSQAPVNAQHLGFIPSKRLVQGDPQILSPSNSVPESSRYENHESGVNLLGFPSKNIS